jgi:hypothetical protein
VDRASVSIGFGECGAAANDDEKIASRRNNRMTGEIVFFINSPWSNKILQI